jgi:REP element-mobilizing transposase RayT
MKWEDIPLHFPFVKLGAFVIMPNHMHEIIIIDKPIVEMPNVASLCGVI